MTTLHPSFVRMCIRLVITFLILAAICDATASYNAGILILFSSGAMASLCIGLPIFVIFIWFAFVPKSIEFSERKITIETLLGKGTYNWDEDLYSFGYGNNVFLLKFTGDRQPYQIFAGAYPRNEWKRLIELLNNRYPERKMAFVIGTSMFPRK